MALVPTDIRYVMRRWRRGRGSPSPRRVALAGTSEVVQALSASSGFLRTFGAAPYAGRTFTSQEDDADSDSVMVSYEAWQRRFGGDPISTLRTE
jgi:hypothetical protein